MTRSRANTYPDSLATCLMLALRFGALLIERQGFAQANNLGKVVLTAVDMGTHWRVDNQGHIHEVAK